MGMWKNPLAEGLLEPREAAEPEIIEPIDGDSLSYLQSLYRDPSLPAGQRMRAAIAALPFERPKLAVVAQVNDVRALMEGLRRRRLAQVCEPAALEPPKAKPAPPPFSRSRWASEPT